MKIGMLKRNCEDIFLLYVFVFKGWWKSLYPESDFYFDETYYFLLEANDLKD